MGLGYWDYLSFQEIATNWAKEQGSFTSDEVLQELISSMILGDFEDATGASRVELLTSKTNEPEDEAWQPFTRQDFLGAIACWATTNKETQNKVIVLGGVEFSPEVLKPEDRLRACGAIPGTKVINRKKGQIWVPDPLPWEEARAKVPWKELAEVPLERYPEDVRSAYLESFRIPFAAFAEWSKHHGHETPPFWHGSAKDSRAPAVSGQEDHKNPQTHPANDANIPDANQEKSNRKRDVEADAILKSRIEKVLARARKLWPGKKKHPSQYAMAMELTSTRHADLRYKFSTIKKILAGTYRSSKRLGIPGL